MTNVEDFYQALCNSRESILFLGTNMTISEVRDVVLMLVGILGLGFAVWRISIANRQASASEGQLFSTWEAALNEQFKVGIELLGNQMVTVRTGGVHVLSTLARTNPEEYHVRVMDIFGGFLKWPPRMPSASGGVGPIDFDSPDLVAAIEAINNRTDKQKEIERSGNFYLEDKLRDTPFELRTGRVQRKGGGQLTP